jgi:cytoskeletal protein CcmA (bactofilin family)
MQGDGGISAEARSPEGRQSALHQFCPGQGEPFSAGQQQNPHCTNISLRRKVFLTMWKPNQPAGNTPQSPEPARPATPPAPSFDASARIAPPPPAPQSAATGEQATIGKSLVIKGEVTGSESLYIDGKVEGSINLAGNRVTVGRNGQVAANISAREIVVLGKVRGNVTASDRVDIRSEGSLTGDVTAQRISIEDGAFFKGGIDIRKPGANEKAGDAKAAANSAAKPEPVGAQV